MLTFLNLINYYSGDYISIYILILVTIYIYYYLITNYLPEIILNQTYLIILVILMLIDICTIIIIFYYDSCGSEKNIDNVILKEKTKKSKRNRKNKEVKTTPIELIPIANNSVEQNLQNTNTNLAEPKLSEIDSKKNYNSIKVFGDGTETISTYK